MSGSSADADHTPQISHRLCCVVLSCLVFSREPRMRTTLCAAARATADGGGSCGRGRPIGRRPADRPGMPVTCRHTRPVPGASRVPRAYTGGFGLIVRPRAELGWPRLGETISTRPSPSPSPSASSSPSPSPSPVPLPAPASSTFSPCSPALPPVPRH